jgi:hypothetical protein
MLVVCLVVDDLQEQSQLHFLVSLCRVLILRVKTKGLIFIGCAWQYPWWRHCSESLECLQGEKLRSWIGQRRCLCTVSFLEVSLLDRATRSWQLWRGLFSLIIFYFCLCVSVISFGHLVGAEAWCNWYLCDINIFFFSKKVEVSVIPIFTKRRAMILRKWTREEEMSSYL